VRHLEALGYDLEAFARAEGFADFDELDTLLTILLSHDMVNWRPIPRAEGSPARPTRPKTQEQLDEEELIARLDREAYEIHDRRMAEGRAKADALAMADPKPVSKTVDGYPTNEGQDRLERLPLECRSRLASASIGRTWPG
jgi:hypothetical protein